MIPLVAKIVKTALAFALVEDLTALEKINLLLVGMASHNNKLNIPNDINVTNQIIPPKNLKSQTFLNNMQGWTSKPKMALNEDKKKCMVFNFTKKKQFSTRLKLNVKILETVREMKLLGPILTDKLKWEKFYLMMKN